MSPAIRWGFPLFRLTTNNLISPTKFCYNTNLPFLNNHKDLDPSYKMDLDFWDCFANAQLQLQLENSMSKKGHNYVKKNLRVTCPTGMGSPFNSKQLV